MSSESLPLRPFAIRICAIIMTATLFTACGPGAKKRALSEQLKSHIRSINTGGNSAIEDEPVHNPDYIAKLYGTDDEGILDEKWSTKSKIDELLGVIKQVSADGLRPEDYHLARLEDLSKRISSVPEPEEIASLDLLLTDALVLLASHLGEGKVDAATIDPQWKASRRKLRFDLEAFIDSVFNNRHIAQSIEALSPQHREYKNLKKALQKYRGIAESGGWEPFAPTVNRMSRGLRHSDVARLRKRINITQGDSGAVVTDEILFDDHLHEQVVRFQKRNGLTGDGIVSDATLEAMNISVEERIAVIEANLERWRWLSDDLGERYVKVNIANYELQVVVNDTPAFVSEAIVGQPFRKTPVFSSRMNHLVLAPTWTVPPTILAQDLIPAVRKNPNYLVEKEMKILRPDGSEVDPSMIDWNSHNPLAGGLRIRQAPGPKNALGAVKFMFPNEYNVYIHDTPTRNLFAHTVRSFSSGCIRISKPLELAAYLLEDQSDWTPARIRSTIAQGQELTIFLKRPINTHLIYLTAWAADDGTVYFRKDIYDRDQPLLKALKQSAELADPTPLVQIGSALP